MMYKIKRKNNFIIPDYEKYCLSNIPSTITKILDAKTDRPVIPFIGKSEKVVLLFLDGFGFNHWNNLNHSVKKAFECVGTVLPITTVFPSTTAAAVTSIHTGLTPQEHALFEWHMYFKEIDMILTTLPFKSEFDAERFKKLKPNAEMIFNAEVIYQKLRKQGIKSYAFIGKQIKNSVYSKMVHKGATVIPYNTIPDLFMLLKKKLLEKEKAYYFIYWPEIDTLSHIYGPFSKCVIYEEISFFNQMKRFIENIPISTAKETTLMISADHGQIEVNPKKTLFLNKYKWFKIGLKKSKQGRDIQPYGSPRDMFVQVKPEKIDVLIEKFEKLNMRVLKVKDAIRNGIFGINKPSREFIERAGDIIVLPKKNDMIWYKHTKNEDIDFYGMHGGLTQDEVIIPFATANMHQLLREFKKC